MGFDSPHSDSRLPGLRIGENCNFCRKMFSRIHRCFESRQMWGTSIRMEKTDNKTQVFLKLNEGTPLRQMSFLL